ncbi:hypothetical protein ACFVS2_20390 [Brevibacillus sp. NPDC058079]|uniref:hypothetical protein n=1 Tax=Brevibacillus sp. NPDC058079 TaxID=3346330 RepID=UPI0036E4B163
MDAKQAVEWAQQVYKNNYQENWSTDFCLWFQFSLRDYALAGFPNGEHLVGHSKWTKENGTEYKGE